jgi:hypothetical protein
MEVYGVLSCILYDVETEFLHYVYKKYIIQCVESCNILLKSVLIN